MENALSVVRQLRIESIMITTTASFVAFYAIDAMSVYRMLRMMYTANGPAHTSPIGERTRVAYGIHFLDGKQSAKGVCPRMKNEASHTQRGRASSRGQSVHHGAKDKRLRRMGMGRTVRPLGERRL